MSKKEIHKLMSGYKKFRDKFFGSNTTTYDKLSSQGQRPKTLIIGCSDSRVDPAILTSASPGELFVVRNVANLVPPFEAGGGYHGISAAIEFAVINLQVENIIIMGHRQCGGIRGLLFPDETQTGGFVQSWMKIAEPARERAISQIPVSDPDILSRCCEMESVRTSIENLRTFPFVQEAIQTRDLSVMGMYFDLENGELLELNDQNVFVPILTE